MTNSKKCCRLQLESNAADLRYQGGYDTQGCATVRNVERSDDFVGMSISQHVQGINNARCLIAMALMVSQIGCPGLAYICCGAKAMCRRARQILG